VEESDDRAAADDATSGALRRRGKCVGIFVARKRLDLDDERIGPRSTAWLTALPKLLNAEELAPLLGVQLRLRGAGAASIAVYSQTVPSPISCDLHLAGALVELAHWGS
jgi:hypothetical protein